MATAHRLAAQTTTASRARAVVATTKPAAPMKPFAASTEIATKLTRPEPFSFATTSRTKGAAASGPMRAEEAVDFSKMLRNFNAANPTVCLSCIHISVLCQFSNIQFFSVGKHRLQGHRGQALQLVRLEQSQSPQVQVRGADAVAAEGCQDESVRRPAQESVLQQFFW